jgi:ubiquinone/menaquinone biosynthesis C-methylase UbiE
VIGVDLAEGFHGRTGLRRQNGIGNVEVQTGSVYMLNFPDDHFDACFCHSTLEATAHPIEALGEMRRTLKPGGVLAAASVA